MPKQAGKKRMKGRPIIGEEFDRLIAAVPKVRKNDPERWRYYLRGLWLSGLRLGESIALSWDDDQPFSVDLDGEYPRFRILGEAQKSGKDELLPMTPDFAEFLLATPEDQRTGRVFDLDGINTGKTITGKRVCRIVSDIGQRAGVVTDSAKRQFATAHDLRRTFGSRWA